MTANLPWNGSPAAARNLPPAPAPTRGRGRVAAAAAASLVGATACAVAGLALASPASARLAPAAVEQPAAVAAVAPPAAWPTTRLALPKSGLDASLVTRDLTDVSRAEAELAGRTEPFLTTTTSRPALALPDRDQPYDLGSLANDWPALLVRQGEALLLTQPLLVGRGATLVIDSATVPVLRLSSGGDGYAQITNLGNLEIEGRPRLPVSITSWDPATSQPDLELADGRAHIVSHGGRMVLDQVSTSWLGATTGATSGVAWMARVGRSATGGATDSSFNRNFFGAYASDAKGLRMTRVAFTYNIGYGFDPHTHTRDLHLTQAIAIGNGSHGIICSRGCEDITIRDTVSAANNGAGVMIDDGNPQRNTPIGSVRNRVVNVLARDNAGPGIVIEGGSDNLVEYSRVLGNTWGIWVRGATNTVVVANTVADNSSAGIRITGASNGTAILGNTVTDSHAPIDIAASNGAVWATGNDLTNDRGEAIRLTGQVGPLHLANLRTTSPLPDPVLHDGNPEGADIPGLIATRLVHPTTVAIAVAKPAWERLLHATAMAQWALVLIVPFVLAVRGVRRRRLA